MAATSTDSASRSSRASSPEMSVPSMRFMTSRTEGAARRGTSGRVVVAMPLMPRRAWATAERESAGHLLATTATVRARLSEISAMETSTELRTSSGAP